jgi:TPR repeat protein
LAVDKREQGNLRAAIFWFKKAVAMNDWSACVQLAKIYAAKKGGEKPAVELLRRVLPMSVDDASELDKKEAESLLRSLQGTGSKSRTKALRRSRRARR